MPLDTELSVDEVIVPNYGRQGTKRFIRGKPIRYSYKLWASAASKWYLYTLEP